MVRQETLKIKMFQNMDDEEKKQYGPIVRMLVRALKTARDKDSKVIVEFEYGRRHTNKKHIRSVKGQLVFVEWPYLMIKDTKGGAFKIGKVRPESLRYQFEEISGEEKAKSAELDWIKDIDEEENETDD